MKQKTQKGFTLIELLVVIAIIGLLASVVLLALGSARSKSRDAKRVADARQLSSALELYFNDNNGYPTTSMGQLIPTYVGIMPNYPEPDDGASCANFTSYTTSYSGTATAYTFQFCLGQTAGGLAPGTRSVTQSGIQ